MTELTLNHLDRYVATHDQNMTDMSVLQFDGGVSFNISETDKRYAFTRSDDDKTSNLKTRQAVFSALKNAGLDMNNLSPAMKDALKIKDFSLDANGQVTSTRPLSDRRLRAIVKQAKIELAGKAWAESAENKASLSKINIEGRQGDPELVGIHLKDVLSYTTPDKARAELYKVFGRDLWGLQDDVFFKTCHGYLDKISKGFDDLFSANKTSEVDKKNSLNGLLDCHYTIRAAQSVSNYFSHVGKDNDFKTNVYTKMIDMVSKITMMDLEEQKTSLQALMKEIKASGKFTENEIAGMANLMRTLTDDESLSL